jgi:ubiquinol-cytochrome c reductase cytochrome b subunit
VERANLNKSETLLERLGLERIITRLQALEVPNDAFTWSRFFGALILVLIVLLLLSGAFMAFYYSPVPGTAYDSVDFALFTLPFGDIIKGIHHYAWNLLLVVMGLHFARAFIYGAYKAPRQLVWFSGVMILLIVPLFIITGELLPWDQKGYWSTKVRLSIISSVPLIGDFIVQTLQGGSLTGIVALTRFYVLHIIFLPCLLVFLITVHLYFISHRGLSGPLKGNKNRQRVSFLPNMINRWLLLFLFVTCLLGLISRYWTVPFGDPADPTDLSYIPMPEWWVLFLNQLVTIFTGPLTVIATVIIPGGLAGLVFALPFLDRSPERHPARRKKIMLIATVIVTVLIALSVMGYIEHYGSPPL